MVSCTQVARYGNIEVLMVYIDKYLKIDTKPLTAAAAAAADATAAAAAAAAKNWQVDATFDFLLSQVLNTDEGRDDDEEEEDRLALHYKVMNSNISRVRKVIDEKALI